MSKQNAVYHQKVEECVDAVIKKVGKKIILGLPLGLGKPNNFVNELYNRAKKDKSIELTICTALSLERPAWSSDLERRFLEPFVKRLFDGYVDLEYVKDMRGGTIPSNIEVMEFYTKAGAYLNLHYAQQNYISSNYTHVYRDLLDTGINVIGQIVSRKEIEGKPYLSLSCNPDVSLDLSDAMREQEANGKKIAIVAQINDNLPFMYGDAKVEPDAFTDILDAPEYNFRLFGAPKMAITTTDFMIGFHASSLIKDNGTLQIGIGSLGDALVYGLQVREENNDVYKSIGKTIGLMDKFGSSVNKIGGIDKFKEGITGSTEMLVDGYLHLIKSGIVKRKTYNNVHIQRLINEGLIEEKITPDTIDVFLKHKAIQPKLTVGNFKFLKEFGIVKDECTFDKNAISIGGKSISADLSEKANLDSFKKNCLGTTLKKGILIHGGFFLGPESFYEELKNMNEDERKKINMTSVLNVNQLYEGKYSSTKLKLLQRKNGRFVNACLMVTLSGAVVSDGLESGQMVSGVGGQYNFVSQAHALPDGRSILMCKSTRTKGKDVKSNIVFNYGHITIPRHLRDIVITEYGIAELRGKSDKEIIAALINIADSRFQEELLEQAIGAGKIPAHYEIPDKFRNNNPERLEENLDSFRKKGYFKPFPFGTDFTDVELIVGKALKTLKSKMTEGMSKVSSLGKAITMRTIPEEAMPYLKRLNLENPANAKEKMMRNLVVYALALTGQISK